VGETAISIGSWSQKQIHTMGQVKNVARSSPLQERKYRRFSLQYPVRLKVHDADLIVEFAAMSRNISICGLLLETCAMIPQDTSVSFTVTVESCQLGRPIRFVGEGKVVRVAPKAAAEGFAIAVECERPITQIDHYLGATGS
jgi:PilZ domain